MSTEWVVVNDYTELQAAESLAANLTKPQVLTPDPQSYYEFDCSDLPVTATHQYITHDEIDEIATRNLPVVYEACERFDNRLQSVVQSLPDSFRFFESLSFQLRWMINGLHYRYRELSNFIQSNQPAVIHYWSRGQCSFPLDEQGCPRQQRRNPLTWGQSESVTGMALEALQRGDRFDCQFVERTLPENDETPEQTSSLQRRLTDRSKGAVKRILNRNQLATLRKVDFETVELGRLLGRSPSGRRAVVTEHNPYVWAFITHDCNEDADFDAWIHWDEDPVSLTSGRVISLRSPAEPTILGNWDEPRVRSLIKEWWQDSRLSTILPSDLAPVVLDRLARFTQARLPVNVALHNRAREYFRRHDIDCILAGPNDRHRTKLISQAGAVHGVPTASFQHGGAYGYVNNTPLLFDETMNDLFCAFGAVAGQNIESYACSVGESIESVPIGIGHVRMGHEIQPLDGIESESSRVDMSKSAKPTLLYVSSGMSGVRRQGPGFWYDDIEYLEHQLALTDLLSSLNEYDVVYKLHYKSRVPNPLGQYIETQARDIDVVREPPLTEILSDVDVVLVDRPTTTLLEAMLFDKPTIFLDLGWFDWFDGAHQTLARCLPIVDQSDGWENRLLETLGSVTRDDAEIDYQPFLEEYCNPRYRPERLWTALQAYRPTERS